MSSFFSKFILNIHVKIYLKFDISLRKIIEETYTR